MRFANRYAAGRELAGLLAPYRAEDAVVLALPRGGVPVAFEIARTLGAPLDVLVARKLGAPCHPELAIGAVAPGATVLDDALIETLRVPESYVAEVTTRERAAVASGLRLFRGDRPDRPIADKAVVLVDDGIATGATILAAVESAGRRGAREIVVAAPVCAPEAFNRVKQHAHAVVCVDVPPVFQAVGSWYVDFTQTTDEEVLTLLERAEVERNATEGGTLASV